jgi:hypothetical protein
MCREYKEQWTEEVLIGSVTHTDHETGSLGMSEGDAVGVWALLWNFEEAAPVAPRTARRAWVSVMGEGMEAPLLCRVSVSEGRRAWQPAGRAHRDRWHLPSLTEHYFSAYF